MQQRVLDDLGQRRVDPVLALGDLAGGLAERHRLDERLDHGGRFGADDVGAEEQAALGVGEDLGETGGVLACPSGGDAGVVVAAGDVADTAGDRLLLGQADAGDLRMGEHGRRHEAVVTAHRMIGVEQVVAHDARLVVGDVLELPRRADVAEREDALDARSLVLVDGDVSGVVDLHAGGGDGEAVAVGASTGGDEHHVGLDGQTRRLHPHARGSGVERRRVDAR